MRPASIRENSRRELTSLSRRGPPRRGNSRGLGSRGARAPPPGVSSSGARKKGRGGGNPSAVVVEKKGFPPTNSAKSRPPTATLHEIEEGERQVARVSLECGNSSLTGAFGRLRQ